MNPHARCLFETNHPAPSAAEGSATLQIEGPLTVATVASWAARLRALLEDHAPLVVVDLGRVDRCDTMGIQLLLAVRAAADEARRALCVAPLSAVVAEAAAAAGCTMSPPPSS